MKVVSRVLAICCLLLVGIGLHGCGDESSSQTTNNDVADNNDDSTNNDDNTNNDDSTNNHDSTNNDDSTNNHDVPIVIPEARLAGTRAPLTMPCDPVDPAACQLPWPSDTFTVADPTTDTGLRLHIDDVDFYPHDDASSLSFAEGHSRISPIVTTIPGRIDPDTLGDGIDGAIQVIVTEPGPHLGERVPLRFLVVVDEDHEPVETTLVAYPRVPMEPTSEHLVVVLNALHSEDAAPLAQERLARTSLGLDPPETQLEAELFAWHGPSREALDLDPTEVVRMWSFTTRSADEPTRDLLAARAIVLGAVERDEIGVEIDEVETFEEGSVAAVVLGRLTEVPRVATPSAGLFRDDNGAPVADGVRDVLFRVAVPRGEGDYKVVMYGHGMGGDVTDPAFDRVITGEGAAKVGIQFDDWTTPGLTRSAGAFGIAAAGSDMLAAGLIENIVGGMAVQRALEGVLGDTLAADTINDLANPAAGRRPSTERAVWAGGSLGGTTGMVYASVTEDIGAAVLNVPGAGFSHFLRFSELYSVLDLLFDAYYPTQAEIHMAIAIAQVNLDRCDGAAFLASAPSPTDLLIQESVGDPILPNIGTDLAAASAHALHLGEVIHPIWGLQTAPEANGGVSITQYRVLSDDSLSIHGFADRDGPAGVAAQEQIRVFISSYWETGVGRMVVPSGCMENEPVGSCDFGGQ